MIKINKSLNYMKALAEMVGAKTCPVIVDYRDNNYMYYHVETLMLIPPGIEEAEAIETVISHYTANGFTVAMIYEPLHGYTLVEIEEMSNRDIYEAGKHIRIMYADIKEINN